MYVELKGLIPDITWRDALPTEEIFESFSDTLIILDDMKDDVVNDSSMMTIITELSHHLKINVILILEKRPYCIFEYSVHGIV